MSTCADDSLYLSDLSPKDKPWDVHREQATAIQGFYNGSEFQAYADRIRACSRLLDFALAAQPDGQQKFVLQNARFCRVRYCPVCQWRKTLMWVARSLQALPRIAKDYPKARWIFLTLTIKNPPIEQLRETCSILNHAFSKLTKRKRWPAIGYLKSLEVTRNQQTNEAHPHLHILMLVPSSYFSGKGYVKQKDWVKIWQSCLKVDYEPSVHVKAVKSNHKGSDKGEGTAKAIREVFKYSVKPADLVADEAWFLELTVQMKGLRTVEIGGVLHDYMKADEPEDLLVSEDSDPSEASDADPRLTFGWNETKHRYKLHKSSHGET